MKNLGGNDQIFTRLPAGFVCGALASGSRTYTKSTWSQDRGSLGGRGEEGRQLEEGCTSQLRKGSLSLYPVAETLLFTF